MTTPEPTDPRTAEFTERFAGYWTANGGSEIEGRIFGRLMLDESGGMAAAELATELSISRGSVSMAVRRLEQAGFVRRHRRPGSRADWFVMDDDVWAGFLERENNYLLAQRELAAAALEFVPVDSPAHSRVRNMHDYMSWLIDEVDLPGAWRARKEQLASRRGS